jgi:hypothetical protein
MLCLSSFNFYVECISYLPVVVWSPTSLCGVDMQVEDAWSAWVPRMAWCLSSFFAFAFWSLSGWALIRVFESLFIFYLVLDLFFEEPKSSHRWCILRCCDDDFFCYFMNSLRLFYDYDDLWLFWIIDGVTSWTFVIICWIYY